MHRRKRLIIGIIIILSCATLFTVYTVLFSAVHSTKEVIQGTTFYNVDPEEALKLIKKYYPLILDVRTEPEFNTGYIKMAKNLPLQELEHRLVEIKDFANKEILIYCRTGRRSSQAAIFLGKNGFKKIYHLKGGIKTWESAGYEMIKIENMGKVSLP